jgi:hypothetical protein
LADVNVNLCRKVCSTFAAPFSLQSPLQFLLIYWASERDDADHSNLSIHRFAPDEPREMTAQPKDWALFLGSWEPFALALAPFLSNEEIFRLSQCSRKVLGLRYTLVRWSVTLNDTSYDSFATQRYTVPPCYADMKTFDFVAFLGPRLSVEMHTERENVDALAGVHTLVLNGCKGLTDVSALCGVHTLSLRQCEGITDVWALGGVHTLDLSFCPGITDVSALGGVNTLNIQG